MRCRRLDLNLLLALHVLLMERSVTRAAARLNVTQPAMSGSPARLRGYFRDPLIQRVGQTMELTPLARALVGPIRDIMRRIDVALATDPGFDPATSGYHFTLSASDYVSQLLLHDVLREAGREAPGVTFEILQTGPRSLIGLDAGEIASHGYFVIALGRPRSERRGVAAPTERQEPDETSPEQLLQALDWAVRENADAGGSLYGRLDLARVAVMGHSCGGLQALAVSPDPRITTTVLFNSGVYVRGGRSGVRIGKEIRARLHGPIAYFTGGPDDMAHPNALDDLQRIDQVPAFLGALPVGHSGTFWSQANGGEWAAVAVRWLDWHLGGNAAPARHFAGPDCILCTDARWTVIRRGLD